MKNSAQLIKQYIHAVRKELVGSCRRKKTVLKLLKIDLLDFAEEFSGNLQFADLEAHFGSPKMIAAELSGNSCSARPRSLLRKLVPVFIAIPILLTAILIVSIHALRSVPDIPEISISSLNEYGFIYEGGKTAIYRDNKGMPLMSVTVDSVFRDDGRTVKPKSASISVMRLNPNVHVDKQYAYYSGNVVYGCTTVTYDGKTTTQFLRVYCDDRGRFS